MKKSRFTEDRILGFLSRLKRDCPSRTSARWLQRQVPGRVPERARVRVVAPGRDYNEVRLHGGIGGIPPARFAVSCRAIGNPATEESFDLQCGLFSRIQRHAQGAGHRFPSAVRRQASLPALSFREERCDEQVAGGAEPSYGTPPVAVSRYGLSAVGGGCGTLAAASIKGCGNNPAARMTSAAAAKAAPAAGCSVTR